jgi:hypothetical protein
MNPHDAKNLRFIMSLNNDQIAQWAMTITEDDMQYAFELIELAKIELIDKEIDVTEDLSLAKKVLKRYTK